MIKTTERMKSIAVGVMSIAAWMLSTTVMAQDRPIIQEYIYDDQAVVKHMSDNGDWFVVTGGEAKTRLINSKTSEVTEVGTSEDFVSARDVSNDGDVVVGTIGSEPGCWHKSTGQWTMLETKSPYVYGNAMSVTPDGTLAAGVLYYGAGYNSIPALWDLSTGKLIETEGLPTKDMAHLDQKMMDFSFISSDGRYLLGCMSYSYLPTSEDLGGCFYFVYDREQKTYHAIGFDESDTQKWTPQAKDLIVIMDAAMSNNGRYVTGQAHVGHEIEGSEFLDEYETPFLYDVVNDKFTLYDETAVQGAYGSTVTNNGIVLSASPVSTPIREWSVRSGKYWFSFSEILSQKYGMTFSDYSESSNTGTPINVSDDGLKVVAFPDPYSSYVAELPVSVEKICEGMKLLGSYTASPVENSTISHLKNVTVTFDRNITAVGGANTAQILDDNDAVVYNSVGFSAEGKTLSIRFRTGTLEEGKTYSLYIPEGTVALNDDATQTNSDLYILYNGRTDEPVRLVSAYPADNSTFSKLDYSTNPIILDFEHEIKCPSTAKAVLYRNDEPEPYCTMVMAYGDKQAMIYPSSTLYLYNGNSYRLEIADSSFTDVAGNNPSNAITLHYTGNYERSISSDDIILFKDGFEKGTANFMMWCGDQNTPTEDMQNWDFTKGMAWGIVLESYETGDYIGCSHSTYTPAGESDDWLVTPQIYLPDMLCSVKFLSQSYKKDKNDILKVVVWPQDNVYNELTADAVAKMKAEGTVIYEKKQEVGDGEETLSGEWTHNEISLAQFAGKNVYIAFVNQNKDQSAIFIDSIEVRHDMNFLVALNYDERVVSKTETSIKGSITGNNEAKTYSKAVLTLRDSEGNNIDTCTLSDMNLGKGSTQQFSFTKTLPLTVGQENKFTLLVDLDGEQNEIKGSVKDLAFQPTKRVVLEEYSGRACGNCPLGIIAIEKLQQRYGSQFIPICIRTYNNDPASSGLSSYSSNLGLDDVGAPSGIINRTTPCYPAVSVTLSDVARYFYSASDLFAETTLETDKLWADYVADEIATPAEGDIAISCTYNEASSQFVVPCTIRYALNANNLNINLFATLVEDNVSVGQSNYFASISSPDLGEWGLGGKYGQATVTGYLMNDICRNIQAQTINGTGGLVPTTMEAGQEYNAEIRVKKSSIVTDINACKVIVMMVDANTGKVINAAVAKCNGGDGIEAINNEQLTINNASSETYNVAGQRVNGQYRGIILHGGKKVLRF